MGIVSRSYSNSEASPLTLWSVRASRLMPVLYTNKFDFSEQHPINSTVFRNPIIIIPNIPKIQVFQIRIFYYFYIIVLLRIYILENIYYKQYFIFRRGAPKNPVRVSRREPDGKQILRIISLCRCLSLDESVGVGIDKTNYPFMKLGDGVVYSSALDDPILLQRKLHRLNSVSILVMSGKD